MKNMYRDLLLGDGGFYYQQIADALRGLVRIVRGSNEIFLVEESGWLTSAQKLIVFVLGRHALGRLGQLDLYHAGASSADFPRATGIGVRVCQGLLCRLRAAGILGRDKSGFLLDSGGILSGFKKIDKIRSYAYRA